MQEVQEMKVLSSLDKVRACDDVTELGIKKLTALKGESVNFQVYVRIEQRLTMKTRVESELSDYITLYAVKDAVMDYIWFYDDDVITEKPGLMPDILSPIDEQNGYYSGSKYGGCMWVNVKLPKDVKAGEYNIRVYFGNEDFAEVTLEVIDEVIEDNKLKYTQWFHPDCIASYYNVPMYSERHWELIENYMKMAKDIGINMILTPVLSLNLDVDRGEKIVRPDCALVDITVNGGEYSFEFSKLSRYVDTALGCGIEYFEISHLFMQGGAYFCCNVEAVVDGERKLIFNTTMKSDIPEYVNFIKKFVPAVVSFLEEKGVLDKCYFHISDEPNKDSIPYYQFANSYVKPMFKGRPLMDALSHTEFCDMGLVDIAVANMADVENFFDTPLPEKWTYYCCGDYKSCNRFLNMPQYRNRITGLQLYKYGYDGFLHWGYNFYYTSGSFYDVNPYVSSSSGSMFPSGDAFSVYPGKNGAHPSMRALVFKDGIEDIQVCRTLEKYIGREAVVKLIEDEAGMEITFFNYPKNAEFIPGLMDKIRNMIKEYVAG